MNQQFPDAMLFSECYLFFPKNEDMFEVVEKNKIRKIYEGQVVYEQQELQQLKEFDSFLQMKRYTQKQPDSSKLRLLYATKFKFDKTLIAMQQYLFWKQQELPARATPAIIQSLQTGSIYIHGRDNRYRPNIFINSEKLASGNLTQESITYFLENIITNQLLPGQIENWNIILDLSNLGITQIPRQQLQNLIDYIQTYYKCRSHRIYLLNSSGTIVQNLIKGDIDQTVVAKVIVEKGSVCLSLLQSCHKSQVEIKYGGTSQNLQQFWPPKDVSSAYLQLNEDINRVLISKQQYQEMYQQGKLINNKICKDLLDDCNPTLQKTNTGQQFDNKTKNEAPDPEEAQFEIDDLINSYKQLYNPVTDEYQVQIQESNSNALYVFSAHRNKLQN